MKRTNLYLMAFTGAYLAIAGAYAADTRTDPVTSNDNLLAYSDRDQMKSWSREKETLENALKPGQSREFYRRQLEKMGYRITAVNYDKPDYLEYEVVKGRNSFEVQIDFEAKSKMSKKIDVTTNAWRAEATERAMRDANFRVEYPKTTTPNASRFSDRDRSRAYRSEKDRLEKALRLGEGRDFYKQELEKLGFMVTSVNRDKPDYMEYEIVKGSDTYEVQIDFDAKAGKATKVDVTTNIWKAEATERALKSGTTTASRK